MPVLVLHSTSIGMHSSGPLPPWTNSKSIKIAMGSRRGYGVCCDLQTSQRSRQNNPFSTRAFHSTSLPSCLNQLFLVVGLVIP